jgi:hypothetical protein
MFSKLITSHSKRTDINFKKFYFNNYFYFIKTEVTYNRLKYFCKLEIFKNKPHTSNLRFAKPYLFLNENSRKNQENLYFFNLLKYFQRTFRFFKNFFVKNALDLQFKSQKFLNFPRELNFLTFFHKKEKNRFFSFLRYRNFSFVSKSKRNFKNFRNRDIFNKFLYFRNFYSSNNKFLGFYLNVKLDNFLFNQKKFKRLKWFFKFKIVKTPIYRFKIKKFFLFFDVIDSFFLTSPHFVNKSKNLFTDFKIYPNLLYFLNKSKIYFKMNKIKIYKIFDNIDLPYFSTNFETPFVLNKHAFVYLSHTYDSLAERDSTLSFFKKNNFSFLLKNDIHRFVIKRYLRLLTFNFAQEQTSNLNAPFVKLLKTEHFKNFINTPDLAILKKQSNLSSYFLNSQYACT